MLKALVIDDEVSLTTIISQFLERSGFQVEAATSGEEGLRKAFKMLPDVLVVDVMMPEMDGYEVCRRLRRDPRTAKSVIVVLTARSQLIDREVAMRAGADAHVAKPYQGKALVAEINNLLETRSRPTLPLGYQILVLRLREGAGATTVATNLGLLLSGESERLAVVADMALRDGQVEGRLGLPLTTSWPASSENMIEDLAGRVVWHGSGLFVLPTPPPSAPTPDLDENRQSLRILREWHDYVVVDTPFNMGPMAPALLGASPLVLVVLTPDSAALRTSQASLEAIRKLGMHSVKVWPVLNMLKPEHAGFQEQAEAILGLPVMATLPWAPEESAQAVMNGKPVVLGQPQSLLGQSLRGLAHKVIEMADPPSVEEALADTKEKEAE